MYCWSMEIPQTLLEAIKHFADPKNCRDFMIAVRWDDGIVRCPHCGSEKVTFLAKANLYNCNSKHPKQKFSLKVGTIFEDSPIGLDKWLPAAWLLTNCKNGISSYELARALGITQKASWHVLHRLRHAMTETGLKLGGTAPVEVDETFVGGKVKNMHRNKRPKGTVYGTANKTIVMGMLERGGKVRAGVVDDRKLHNMRPMLEANVHAGSHIITDEHSNYPLIAKENDFLHEVIEHANEYVRGHIHTNGIENFWALLKRGLHGTYISVDAAHLNAYVAEQVFRFNHRDDCNDAGRFIQIMSQIVGKRLTYAELTARQSTN
jgi:transposase-like protein